MRPYENDFLFSCSTTETSNIFVQSYLILFGIIFTIFIIQINFSCLHIKKEREKIGERPKIFQNTLLKWHIQVQCLHKSLNTIKKPFIYG